MAQQKKTEVTGTPMKKRNSREPKITTVNEERHERFEQIKNQTEPSEIKIENQVVGTASRKFAQIINFAELQNIMTQNVSKTANKTYTQYTKEKLSQYLSNPYSNLDNIRDISNYLYLISPQYKTLVNYLANMLLCSYNVVYKTPDWNKQPKLKDFMQSYQELCVRLKGMGVSNLTKQMIATSLRDGIYVGFVYDNGDKGFYVNVLDPKYCKISALTIKNTYMVKFNAAYFDSGNNKEFIYGVNEDGKGVWDAVFKTGYETYKKQGRDFQWFELPVERTFCIPCGSDPNNPLPFFFGIFQDLLDILDYRDLIRSKTELENYVLLISKIPLIHNSDQINDFSVDLGLVQATQAAIDESLPSLVGSAYTPCEVEKITFGNQNQVQETNVYSESIKSLFDSIGISQMLFNGEKSGSVGLRHSIRVDESTMLELLEKAEANFQRYIELNISDEFDFYFHKVTIFGQDEYITTLKDMASLGLPCKTDLATITKTPLDMMNATFMENALGLVGGENPLWRPLSTSYTQPGSDTGGAPTKNPDELSDSGAATKDANKNGGTKAGK